MNDREKAALKKLSLMTLAGNEIKALLHMLAGGSLHSCPVVPGSLERVITTLKDKHLIEKVDGKYRLCAEYAGAFAVDFDAQKRSPRAEPAAPPTPAPATIQEAPVAPAISPPPPQPVQPALQAASTAKAPEMPARFVAFSTQARRFLSRARTQHQRAMAAWFELGYGESDGQKVLDVVSDLAAGTDPKHSPALDRLLQTSELLACNMFG